MEHLLVCDVPSIKQYVFGTERLTEIRGASGLLDDLNRRKTTARLKQQLGEDKVICDYAGGGSAQFRITASSTDLEAAIQSLKGLFHQETNGGLRLIAGHAERTDSGYRNALDRAFVMLEREKDEEPFPATSPLHNGLLRECGSCSAPASEIYRHADDDLIVCSVCRKKSEYTKMNRDHWSEFNQYLNKNGFPTAERPRDLESIGEKSAKQGYLALVYADGNSIGKLVKSINTPERFTFFSKTVDESIREACHEALQKKCLDSGGTADILLLGGDDLLVCLTADTAFPFACAVARKFEEKTQARFAANPKLSPEVLNGQGITISLGVVFAKSHTPFSILLDQADELLKSAKEGGADDTRPRRSAYYAPAYLDFHVFAQFNQVKVAESRQRYLTREFPTSKKLLLYQKPYRIEDAAALLDHARKLAESGIFPSRLKQLGRAPFLGKNSGSLACLKLIGRARDKTHKECIWNALKQFKCDFTLPWREQKDAFSTMLADLMEVVEFLPTPEKERRTDA